MLTGLTAGAPQTWGAVRIVPLLRDEPITDLRLHPRIYGEDSLSIVELDDKTAYVAFIPHGYIADWTDDGSPAASYGTSIDTEPECCGVVARVRMARREDRNRVRLLPRELAIEGYLALGFKGPPIAWQEWTRHTVHRGLSPRSETVYSGGTLPELADALRVFEIHPRQCGVALYFADELAGVTVLPHPDDYRAVHPTLLRDCYGDRMVQFATLYPPVRDFEVSLGEVASFADLRAAVARTEAEWGGFHRDVMARGLSLPTVVEDVYRMGRYRLSRFLPEFDPDVDNHVGERITGEDGQVAYLNTFRLSPAQVRRGALLTALEANDWHLDTTAEAMSTTRDGLVRRLELAGWAGLLRPEVLAATRRRAKR
ncbi:ARPP-2 domain-containing protein [Actinokineospora sp. G85]|uniref:ARPP-2 domain-containing protein n=1 Tax=Actinokineospora sp. G85 TaxID=3406626 RepID=UPI003C70E67F